MPFAWGLPSFHLPGGPGADHVCHHLTQQRGPAARPITPFQKGDRVVTPEFAVISIVLPTPPLRRRRPSETAFRDHKSTPAPQDHPFLAIAHISGRTDPAVRVAAKWIDGYFRAVLGSEKEHLVVKYWTELPPGPKG
jgi:hypothetical protein